MECLDVDVEGLLLMCHEQSWVLPFEDYLSLALLVHCLDEMMIDAVLVEFEWIEFLLHRMFV